MFVPIWIIVIILGAIGVVAWWGILRIIHSNDETSAELNKNLDCIDKNLSKINERLGRLETWMEQHEGSDNSRHGEIKVEIGEVWTAIDKIRGT